jgi:hypothetical protein
MANWAVCGRQNAVIEPRRGGSIRQCVAGRARQTRCGALKKCCFEATGIRLVCVCLAAAFGPSAGLQLNLLHLSDSNIDTGRLLLPEFFGHVLADCVLMDCDEQTV